MVTHYANDKQRKVEKWAHTIRKVLLLEPINVICSLEPERIMRECVCMTFVVQRLVKHSILMQSVMKPHWKPWASTTGARSCRPCFVFATLLRFFRRCKDDWHVLLLSWLVMRGFSFVHHIDIRKFKEWSSTSGPPRCQIDRRELNT